MPDTTVVVVMVFVLAFVVMVVRYTITVLMCVDVGRVQGVGVTGRRGRPMVLPGA